jgi:prepilin-type N-terminal cleavage/methylation domain-containing protein
MKIKMKSHPRGFTLLETVIAIGVLAVLLTGFIVVFTPAADGIRKSINAQQADRLASTLEQELVTLRGNEKMGDIKTGFDKAFDRISRSSVAATGLVVYQYRAKKNSARGTDKTPEPLVEAADTQAKIPGENYTVVSVMRKLGDDDFKKDLPAIEGSVYLVKCTQLVFVGGELKAGSPGSIKNPSPEPSAPTVPPYAPGPFTRAADYPEATIAFTADFYLMPAKSEGYFTGTLPGKFAGLNKPVFSRNLAVRR